MQSDYFNTILVSPETVIEEGEKVKKEVNAKTNKHVRQPPTLIKNTKKSRFLFSTLKNQSKTIDFPTKYSFCVRLIFLQFYSIS